MEPETSKPVAGKPRAGRGLKLAFGLSLAVNLVFVGLIAGAAWRFAGAEKGPRGPGMRDFGAPYVRALPREDRRALREALRDETAGLPSRAERRALHEALIAAVRAPEFDAQAVRGLFEQQMGAAQTVLGAAQTGWLEIVATKSAAERAVMADKLEEMMRRGKRKAKVQP